MGRGRPRGSGYDDSQRIEAVTRLMRTGLSRRAAILSLLGPDQLRRIEMKMRISAMTEAANAKLDAIVRATLRGMGLTDEQYRNQRIDLIDQCMVDMVPDRADWARDLGFKVIVTSLDPSAEGAR